MWREGAALRDHVAQGLPRYELHDHERVAPIAPFVEDGDHVRMDHCRGAPGLFGEPGAERLVRVLAEDLDRYVASETLVPGAPYLARTAFVDPYEQPIATGEHAPAVRIRPGFGRHALARPQVARHLFRRAA